MIVIRRVLGSVGHGLIRIQKDWAGTGGAYDGDEDAKVGKLIVGCRLNVDSKNRT